MRNHLKPILSILALAVFLLMAFASEFLDESTNTEVQAEHCKVKPPVTGSLRIIVQYLDEDGDPIVGAAGTLSINHQIIVDTTNCMYDNTHAFINFHLDANGQYEYNGSSFLHDNEADLFRAEVNIIGTKDYDGFREVQVASYNLGVITFSKTDPPSL